jgi:hypothetical protein
MKDSANAGQLDYQREGFTVFWDERGLNIKVIDYHAGILHLSWETLLDLAKRAGSGTSAVTSRGDK